MNLTSYNRMRHYFTDQGMSSTEDPETDAFGFRSTMVNWIVAVSSEIERYLGRNVKLQSYTEYFHARPERRRFFVKAAPISSITSVYMDYTSEWTGDETEIDDVFIADDLGSSVGIPYGLPFLESRGSENGFNSVLYRAIRIIYTGGLASHPVNSVYAVADGASFTVGKWILGGTSNAYGRVVSASASSMTVEVISGIFEADETITQYDTETLSTATDPAVSTTISSVTTTSLAEAYPDLVRAAEMEIRYRFRRKDDYELSGAQRDGTNFRGRGVAQGLQFTDEVARILQSYRLPEVI